MVDIIKLLVTCRNFRNLEIFYIITNRTGHIISGNDFKFTITVMYVVFSC